MSRLIRPLQAAAAVGLAATFALNLVPATGQPPAAPAAPPTAPAPSEKVGEKLSPVKVTNVKVEMKTAVTPQPLSDSVKKGLAWLVKSQQDDGGWNQGGGWRNQGTGGGRVEGKTVEDPSDVGNTCFALLALFRAGHTPTAGEYKDAVAKGLRFVLARVERAEGDSLYITDVRGTQLQGKIGPYVDTFLVNLVLAEMRGSAGPDEERLVAALTKTMNKIVRHQGADGGFANQGGWAPTLSMGLCNKSVARARQNGVEVDRRVLERALADAKTAAEGKALATGPAPAAVASAPAAGPVGKAKAGDPVALAPTGPAPATEGAFSGRSGLAAGGYSGGLGGGDAGVKLYSFGRGAGNSQDAINGLRVEGAQAKEVLKDQKATKAQQQEARQTLDKLAEAEKANDKVQRDLAATVRDERFVAGFGSNGGEEFLSFMHISETLVLKGGKDWTDWDAKMRTGLEKAQDGSGSWSGQHCITGRTFCTSAALLVMMADRTPFPVDVLGAQAEKRDAPPLAGPERGVPMPPRVALLALFLAGCTRASEPVLSLGPMPEPAPAPAPRADTAAAVAFLLKHQSPDGAWRSDVYAAFKDGTALTPLALVALQDAADAGLTGPDTAAAREKALTFLDAFVTPAGEVREPADGFDYPVYTAALALKALCHKDGAARAAAKAAWTKYLVARQLTEANGWDRLDPHYGGWGYCRGVPKKPAPGAFAPPLTESNLSATLFALDALTAAGALTPEAAAAAAQVLGWWQNFIPPPPGGLPPGFVQGDGGFHFVLADPVRNKAGLYDVISSHPGVPAIPRQRFGSYGSATADGLRALLLSRPQPVGDRDVRTRLAADWLLANFRADTHPGQYTAATEPNRNAVYFYYAASVAKAFRVADVGRAEAPADLAAALARKQRPDGSWANAIELVRENDPLVATSQALMALAALRGR